jgi:hypothetical protein
MENVEGQPLAFPHLGLTPLTAPAEPGRLRDFCGAVSARRLLCEGRAEHQSGASARFVSMCQPPQPCGRGPGAPSASPITGSTAARTCPPLAYG